MLSKTDKWHPGAELQRSSLSKGDIFHYQAIKELLQFIFLVFSSILILSPENQ